MLLTLQNLRDGREAFLHFLTAAHLGELFLFAWRQKFEVREKGRSDFVTDADVASQKMISEYLLGRYPGHEFLGEEDASKHRRPGPDAPPTWIVDPIDGTTNFVRGVPVWATLLALEREGVVDLALVSAPALGRRWWAIRGEGAFAEGERLAVSRVARIEDSAISTTSARRMPVGWNAIVQRAWSNRGLGDFWQHCLVAEGSLEIACDSIMEIWDYSSVKLIVEEAGGRATTYEGETPASKKSFVTTNGLLHDEAVSLLRG